MLNLTQRPRRNRKNESIRHLVEETPLCAKDCVVPFFLLPGEGRKEAISSLPGIFRLSADLVIKEAQALHRQKIPAIALFPVVAKEQKKFSRYSSS